MRYGERTGNTLGIEKRRTRYKIPAMIITSGIISISSISSLQNKGNQQPINLERAIQIERVTKGLTSKITDETTENPKVDEINPQSIPDRSKSSLKDCNPNPYFDRYIFSNGNTTSRVEIFECDVLTNDTYLDGITESTKSAYGPLNSIEYGCNFKIKVNNSESEIGPNELLKTLDEYSNEKNDKISIEKQCEP